MYIGTVGTLSYNSTSTPYSTIPIWYTIYVIVLGIYGTKVSINGFQNRLKTAHSLCVALSVCNALHGLD